MNYKLFNDRYKYCSNLQSTRLQLQDRLAHEDGITIICAYTTLEAFELNRIIELIPQAQSSWLEVKLIDDICHPLTGEVILKANRILELYEVNQVMFAVFCQAELLK